MHDEQRLKIVRPERLLLDRLGVTITGPIAANSRLKYASGGPTASAYDLGQCAALRTGLNERKEPTMPEKSAIAEPGLREMVRRIPQWLRGDLNATDPMLRERAEDALVAMIAALREKSRP